MTESGKKCHKALHLDLTDDINVINSTPMEALRFRDFHNLTSGQDAFSRLKLPDLLSNFVPAAVNAIIDAFPGDPDNQAKALRWVLRGLLPDRAIRKVKTDLEVSENAKVRE